MATRASYLAKLLKRINPEAIVIWVSFDAKTELYDMTIKELKEWILKHGNAPIFFDKHNERSRIKVVCSCPFEAEIDFY